MTGGIHQTPLDRSLVPLAFNHHIIILAGHALSLFGHLLLNLTTALPPPLPPPPPASPRLHAQVMIENCNLNTCKSYLQNKQIIIGSFQKTSMPPHGGNEDILVHFTITRSTFLLPPLDSRNFLRGGGGGVVDLFWNDH